MADAREAQQLHHHLLDSGCHSVEHASHRSNWHSEETEAPEFLRVVGIFDNFDAARPPLCFFSPERLNDAVSAPTVCAAQPTAAKTCTSEVPFHLVRCQCRPVHSDGTVQLQKGRCESLGCCASKHPAPSETPCLFCAFSHEECTGFGEAGEKPTRFLRKPSSDFDNQDHQSSARPHTSKLRISSFFCLPLCCEGDSVPVCGSTPWPAITVQSAHQSGVHSQLRPAMLGETVHDNFQSASITSWVHAMDIHSVGAHAPTSLAANSCSCTFQSTPSSTQHPTRAHAAWWHKHRGDGHIGMHGP